MKKTLLALLEESGTAYVSGEAVSRLLGVSRTAVWKQVRRLEEEGYTIEASRRLGYRLAGRPDRLTATSVLAKLRTVMLGRSIKLFDEVDSTQNEAERLAEAGAKEGTLVIAEQQLKGRGRMGRQWVSPKGKGVWMSLILRPNIPMPYAPQLTLLTAVALCRSLRRLTELDIGIKWPNDLLIDGRKISGILLESSAEEDRLKHVVAGIGISVNLDESDYDEELLTKAVSLKLAAGREFDRAEVIAAFLEELEQLYHLYMREGFQPIRMLWEALSVSLGVRASLVTPSERIEGVPTGLADTGALVVRLDDGRELSIFSAEMGSPQARA